jgi:cell division protein FtsN
MRTLHRAFIVGVGCLLISAALSAQTGTSARADSVFARAKQLVVNGNGAAGRLLVDSVVAATSPDSAAYGEALYWRAALAATTADAERDYRRLVVEYPLSPRANEALLQLAQLESARGDRQAASTHLNRFLLENKTSPERGRAALLLVRLSFEQNDPQHGCVVLARSLREVPESEVELRNQLDYYSPRCESVDTTRTASTAGANATSPTPTDSARRDTTRHGAPAKATGGATAKGRYTLQVAAYGSRADADRLAKRLEARGLDVRVVGQAKVFRVRVGRYETRAAAAAAARDLKTKKIDAFVTEIGVEEK